MDKQPPRRRIWDRHREVAEKESAALAGQKLPADSATGVLRGEGRPFLSWAERPVRNNLLRPNFSASPLTFPAFEDAMLTASHDHRLPIDIELAGRCTLPNGRSTTCKTTRISSESVDLVYDLKTASYPMRGRVELPTGSTVYLDLDQVGNFHGSVTAQNADGFQLAVDVDCKGMLIPKLARLAAAIARNPEEPAIIEKSVIVRIEPVVRGCSYRDDSGLIRKGKIINISRFDALIKAPIIPPVASQIVFGGIEPYTGEITRTFEIGFAVDFRPPIPETQFSASIKLLDE